MPGGRVQPAGHPFAQSPSNPTTPHPSATDSAFTRACCGPSRSRAAGASLPPASCRPRPRELPRRRPLSAQTASDPAIFAKNPPREGHCRPGIRFLRLFCPPGRHTQPAPPDLGLAPTHVPVPTNHLAREGSPVPSLQGQVRLVLSREQGEPGNGPPDRSVADTGIRGEIGPRGSSGGFPTVHWRNRSLKRNANLCFLDFAPRTLQRRVSERSCLAGLPCPPWNAWKTPGAFTAGKPAR